MNKKISLTTQLLIKCLIGVVVFSILTFFDVTSYIPEVTALMWFIFLTIVLFSSSSYVIRGTNERFLFWLSYIVKLLYMAFSLKGQDFSNPIFNSDATAFWNVASQYFEGNFSSSHTTFPYFINAEFHIFGKNVACCILTNIFFSMIMLIFIFALMNKFKIFGNIRFIVDCIACLLPYSIIVSTDLLREPLYFALVSMSFYEFALYLEANNTKYLYYSVFLMVPVLILHIGYFPIPLIYFWMSMKFSKTVTKKELIVAVLQLSILMLFIITVLNVGSIGYIARGGVFSADDVFHRISGESYHRSTLDAGSAYLLNLQAHSWSEAILYTPIKTFYYLFSPLPTNWRGLVDVTAFLLDSCVHFYVIFNAFSYLKQVKRTTINNSALGNSKIGTYLVRTGVWQILLCAVVFGLGTSTAGTAIRHRDVLLPIEALILSITLQRKKLSIRI